MHGIKNKLIRFFVLLGMCAATIIILGAVDLDSSVMFGSFTLIGSLFFLVAYDIFSDDTAIAKFLRILFIILGLAVILTVGVLNSFDYLENVRDKITYSIWTLSAEGFWLLGGLVSFWLFAYIKKSNAANYLYIFVPIVSTLFCYLLYVGCAYLGRHIHSFFYAYPGLILCLYPLFRPIYKWIRDIKKYNARTTSQSSKSTTNKNRKAEDFNGYAFLKELKSELYSFSRKAMYFNGDTGEWDTLTPYCDLNKHSASVVSVSGKYTFIPQIKNSPTNDGRAKSTLDDACEQVKSVVESVISRMRDTYAGYDGEWKIETDISVET